MARSYLCGFELGSLGECFTSSGTVSVQNTVKASGGYALLINPTDGTGAVDFRSRSAGGGAGNSFASLSMRIRVDSLSGNSISLLTFSVGSTPRPFILNTDGSLTVGATTSASGLVPFDSKFYEYHMETGYNGTLGARIYINGSLVVSDDSAAAPGVKTNARFGQSSGGITCVIYMDDVSFYDASFGGTLPSLGNILISIPTAGNNAASWTDGDGGTGDIHGSVDNIPPVGVAASTAGTKIKNGATGSNLDYVATMQSYAVAGVPVGSIVNAVQAICNDGEEVTTGTKAGGLWIASNPAQSASTTTFDYGDDTATAVGTFPTGWATHLGVLAENPAITLGTAPTVTVRKVGSTNRTVDVDFMGIYVNYTPPPVAKIRNAMQAVKRANFF